MRKSILIIAAVAIACNKNAEAPSTASQPSPSTAPPAAAQPAPAPASATAPATATVAPTTGAIASTDGEKTGTHIDITELKRASGGTVNLKFVLTNNGNEKLGFWDMLHDKGVTDDAYDVSGVHLVDPVNKKKYFVVVDTEKKCLCSARLPNLDQGQKMNLWAKFPAPPPDVQKVTIEIPHFQPIDDVTISQ